ncbi:hypothetical protein RB620_28340 [Paenibacillus sp. LHD-117]|uniref:hypothetical protein n=1 Tax=Paenibacillus sp. LHD-117 TaxID=3071412 RepID=UPI0027E1061B|nr:hypothetical protein [Paenibacillus sp. LHD-117]MDQ6423345.1 hypothetical protein [Paenibacillus sp. LHD-117]
MSIDPGKLSEHAQAIARIHPWYGRLLSENSGMNGSDHAGSSTLRDLPLLTAELLEEHYYAQPPRTEPGLSVYRTSGTSTGIRKAIYYSPEDDARYIAAKLASFERWLQAGGDVPGPLPVKRALADLGTGHAAGTALRIFTRMGLEGEAIPFSSPVEDHVAKLASFRPDLLYTMPSLLEAIADAWPANEPLGLKRIILVGEMASKEWQANMADRLGLAPQHLLDTYGSIEVGAIAAYSHAIGRYVLADGVHGEALPVAAIGDGYEPLADGEHVLALTSFDRLLFPVIRFVTYDVVRNFEVVEIDGVPRGTFSCIVKRIGPELKHGEKISLYDIEEAVHRHLRDAAVRVAVSGNRLKLHIRSGELARHPEKLEAVRYEVEHRIPDIGMMIRGRLLQGIDIILADEHHPLPSGSVKAKKIYP